MFDERDLDEPKAIEARKMYRTLVANEGFRTHAVVYVAVNLLLLIIDLTVDTTSLWFFWPLLGWGIGLVGHGVAVWRKSQAKKAP